MVEAAGVEPDISVENTQLTDSAIASIAMNAATSKSSVQITYKDLPELQDFQASPALPQHAEVLFDIYTLIRRRRTAGCVLLPGQTHLNLGIRVFVAGNCDPMQPAGVCRGHPVCRICPV
jgi:hypothetical protein